MSDTRHHLAETPRILIVDDDPGQRSLLNSFLRSQGFETATADSGERALEMLRAEKFQMMISDVRMPGLSGLETLRLVRREHDALPVLLVTAFTDVRDAVAAMRDGAVNYLAKPIDLDELLDSVRKAIGISESAPLRYNEDKRLPDYVVARSPLLEALFRDASLIAPSESRVLITGESGVGKEVLADVIHAWSSRAAGPMVKVNCAAIPETLLETELFGHEKGSFTGAHAQRVGRFEEANDGTIFLDEIAEMSPAIAGQVAAGDARWPVSARGFQSRSADQRAHSGRQQSQSGRGSESWPIPRGFVLPFERGGVEHSAVARTARGYFAAGQPVHRGICQGARAVFRRGWPLSGTLSLAGQRAGIAQRDGARGFAFPQRTHFAGAFARARERRSGTNAMPPEMADPARLEEIERQAIIQALRQHDFNRTETAKALGISRRALIYKLQRFRQQGYQVE